MAPLNQRADTFLRGKHAVVTGVSRGIGAAIAAALARLGAGLTLMSRSEACLREQAETPKKDYGVKVEAVLLDVAEPTQIATVLRVPPSGWDRSASSSTMPGSPRRHRSAGQRSTIGSI